MSCFRGKQPKSESVGYIKLLSINKVENWFNCFISDINIYNNFNQISALSYFGRKQPTSETVIYIKKSINKVENQFNYFILDIYL